MINKERGHFKMNKNDGTQNKGGVGEPARLFASPPLLKDKLKNNVRHKNGSCY